ncbi:hypothetical protein F7P73_14805 [Acinetobacter bohemicus]|uniref:Uncharacterized protein n=1 Tax=Acinetobacter bohemicus TaxID=1435036 RepID=A0A1I6VVE7_9GAMM|nr:hypothetical protein [Acinetobacter bohemicus]KAB0650986.1 hypothetical protein F7P73_14805 [Acinetobacter bohemicus]SFT17683.1 hypothetical protein SAMN05444586_103340 [Acinetobacter bohemicus]
MKIKILITTLFFTPLTGCNKQSNPPKNTAITAQLEQSDKKIDKYLNKLYCPNTTQDTRIQILCRDYPVEYKTKYIPALLKSSPDKYTEAKLLANLEATLNYYKNNFKIKCSN